MTTFNSLFSLPFVGLSTSAKQITLKFCSTLSLFTLNLLHFIYFFHLYHLLFLNACIISYTLREIVIKQYTDKYYKITNCEKCYKEKQLYLNSVTGNPNLYQVVKKEFSEEMIFKL